MVVSDPSVNGVLPMEPFMLEANATMRPTTFDITFLAGSAVYRCIVEGTVDGILYESLEQVSEKGSIDVFEREETRSEPAHYKFNDCSSARRIISHMLQRGLAKTRLSWAMPSHKMSSSPARHMTGLPIPWSLSA